MKKKPNSTYLWIKKVINSCNDREQLIACSKLTSYYLNIYPNDVEVYIKLQKQIENIRF